MPDSYWSRHATVIAAVIIGIGFALVVGSVTYRQYQVGRYANSQSREHADANERKATQDIAERCAFSFAPAEAIRGCVSESVSAYQARNNDNQDLQAQQQMAFWALVMAIVSGGSLVISGIALAALIDSLNQTRTAIRNDREIGEAQARAYLSIVRISIGIGVDYSIIFQVSVTNSGHSPAFFAHAVVEMLYAGTTPEGWHTTEARYTRPFELGTVRPDGLPSDMLVTNQQDFIVPNAALKSPDGHALAFKVGVFARDVFLKEISCIESYMCIRSPDDTCSSDQIVRRPIHADIHGDAGLRASAWTDDAYRGHKPTQSADDASTRP